MPHPTTFSIVAVDQATAEIGVAVASKFLAVGAVVPWIRAGCGAIATQAFANTAFGPRALALLDSGASVQDVAGRLLAGDPGREERQFGLVAANGTSVSFTGAACISYAAGTSGDDFAAQGNCLASAAVVEALATTFRRSQGALCDRLLAALSAADAAGGDKRGRQSAALAIEKPQGGYAGFNDRYVDLRVDDAVRPIAELERLLALHKLYNFLPDAGDLLDVDERMAAELASHLRRVGALPQDAMAFDERAREALVAVMHVENLENRVRSDGRIDRQTRDYLAAMPSRS